MSRFVEGDWEVSCSRFIVVASKSLFSNFRAILSVRSNRAQRVGTQIRVHGDWRGVGVESPGVRLVETFSSRNVKFLLNVVSLDQTFVRCIHEGARTGAVIVVSY